MKMLLFNLSVIILVTYKTNNLSYAARIDGKIPTKLSYVPPKRVSWNEKIVQLQGFKAVLKSSSGKHFNINVTQTNAGDRGNKLTQMNITTQHQTPKKNKGKTPKEELS